MVGGVWRWFRVFRVEGVEMDMTEEQTDMAMLQIQYNIAVLSVLENASLQDPPAGLCLRPYGGPRAL